MQTGGQNLWFDREQPESVLWAQFGCYSNNQPLKIHISLPAKFVFQAYVLKNAAINNNVLAIQTSNLTSQCLFLQRRPLHRRQPHAPQHPLPGRSVTQPATSSLSPTPPEVWLMTASGQSCSTSWPAWPTG